MPDRGSFFRTIHTYGPLYSSVQLVLTAPLGKLCVLRDKGMDQFCIPAAIDTSGGTLALTVVYLWEDAPGATMVRGLRQSIVPSPVADPPLLADWVQQGRQAARSCHNPRRSLAAIAAFAPLLSRTVLPHTPGEEV